MSRANSLIEELECSFTNETFLLVSHGDTLQILETAFHQKKPSRHRSEKHLETGQIRYLLQERSD
jgi:broad specificity phosphatase PhoE